MTEVYIKARAGVVSCELGDGVALLDTKSNMYYGLNTTGSVIWDACQTQSSRSALLALMAEKFGVSSSVAEKDLDRLIADLRNSNLIEVSDAPEG